jgi:hypothetical protein
MRAWSPTAIVAATLLVAAQAAADPSAQRAEAPRIASGVADENPSGGGTVDPDPVDDGTVIVECIGRDGHRATDKDQEQGRPKADHSDMPSTRPPLIPLDPSPC